LAIVESRILLIVVGVEAGRSGDWKVPESLGPNWQGRLCWLSLHLQQDDPCQPWWQPICSRI